MEFESCFWTEDENGVWETSCGNAFQFETGGPIDNGFDFCPYCGLILIEQTGAATNDGP